MYVAVNEKGEVKKELKGNWWGEERRREEHDYIMYMYICTYCCKKKSEGFNFHMHLRHATVFVLYVHKSKIGKKGVKK